MHMNKMIRALALVLSVLTAVLCTGCQTPEVGVKLPYDFDLTPYVTLGSYVGLTYTPMDTTVTEEQMKTAIETALKPFATSQEITDRGLILGDAAMVDFTGYMDDVAFDGGSATDYPMTIGSTGFIEGFESGMIGMTVGETRDLNLSFPDPYPSNPDYAGKPCVFRVTVKSITETVLPDLTDDWVKENTDFESVELYRASIEATLKAENEKDALAKKSSDLWDSVLAGSKIHSYPEEEFQRCLDSMVQPYKEYADSYNMTLDQFVQNFYGMTETEFMQTATEYAQQSVGEELVMFSILHAEGISITDEEYAAGAAEYAKIYNYPDVATLEETYGHDTIYQSLLWDKGIELIMEKAVPTTGTES